MKKFKYITLVLLFFFVSGAEGQESIFIVNYNTTLPSGKTNDFIDQFSWRGINVEQRFFLDNNLTVGFLFGWNVLNKKLLNYTKDFGNGAIYGNQYRYINAFPILATAHYHFSPEAYIRPYCGLGIGTYNISRLTEMGLIMDKVNKWHFGFAPEAGLWFDVRDNIGFNLSIRYNYAFKTSEADSYSTMNFNAGLVFNY